MPVNISGTDAKKAREVAKFSQAAVAAAVGLNRTYYSLYESGRLSLTDSQSSALAKFLHTYDALPSTKPTNTQVEATKETKRKESNVFTEAAKSSRTATKEPTSPESSRIRIATRLLIALEQTVAAEQATGRRVPPAIERALASLRMLDYPELLEMVEKRGISLSVIPSLAEFEALEMSKQQKIETQLDQTIVCHAVYGKAWLDCDRRKLYKIACELRKALPNTGKLIPFPSILEEAFESSSGAQKTTSRLRLEIAEHLLKCAVNRIDISAST